MKHSLQNRGKGFRLSLLLTVTMLLVACGGDDDVAPSTPPTPTPTPTPTEEYEPPVTHVYSDESSSEAVVKELRNDGTVVLDASTAKKVPEKGEIIVSGITDAAPYGFLYRVESVQQSGGEIVIKTSEAYLNEVLPHAHVQQRLQFREAGQGAQAPSVASGKRNAPSRAKEADLLHIKTTIPFNDDAGDSFTVHGIKVDSYVKGTVNLDFSLGGTFIWEADGLIPDRAGFILDGSLSLSVVIEAATKAKFEKKLGGTPLEPMVFLVAGLPVVIVPYIDYKYGIKTEGKVYAKWKPIDIKAMEFDCHAIYNKQEDVYGDNMDLGASKGSEFSDLTAEGMFQEMLNAEAGLEGEAKFSVWPEVRFCLYNSENVSFSAGISPYAKVSGELALKWQKSNSSDLLDDFELKDNLSVSIGAEIPLSGKLEFKAFGKKIGGEKEGSFNLIDYPLIEGASLLPVFNDFLILPEEDALEHNYVHVTAYKGATMLALFGNYEEDYGFCLAQVKKDAYGMELPKDWTYYSLKSQYEGSGYGLDRQLRIELDIPTSGLQPNATYEVRPYTVLKVGSTPYYFWRKGGTFKTGGAVGDGGGVVIDVPGENL